MHGIVTIVLGIVALVIIWVAVIVWIRKSKKKKLQALTTPVAKTTDGTVKPEDKKPAEKPVDKSKNTWI